MKEPFGHGSIRHAGSRWLLDAYGSLTWKTRAHLVLRAVRPGVTVGPLPASAGRAAWLSIVATGLVDGVVETPSGRIKLRGWYGAHVHEWATYSHSETRAYVRRDLALLWRSTHDIRLVWGLEPYRRPTQGEHAGRLDLARDQRPARREVVCLPARVSPRRPQARRADLRTADDDPGGTLPRLRLHPRPAPSRRQDRRHPVDHRPDLHRARHLQCGRCWLPRTDDPRQLKSADRDSLRLSY